jgi:hypothetical protein
MQKLGSRNVAQYLISFDEGAMTFPEEDLPDVDAAAHAVIQEAMDAGVWVLCGGVTGPEHGSIVATDGRVTHRLPENKQYLGGFAILEVSSREEALEWAGKFANACRCAQEVREIMADPKVHRGPAVAADALGFGA